MTEVPRTEHPCARIKAKDDLMGSEGYEYKDSLIVLIARLNFDVDAVPFHMAEDLIKLTKAIEEDV